MAVINSNEGVILASDMLGIVNQSSYTNDTKIDVQPKDLTGRVFRRK